MAAYREVATNHPTFRERSETPDLIVEISMQPYEAFGPDAVILFSDILTPLPAMGVEFDIIEKKGPTVPEPIRTKEGADNVRRIDLSRMDFVSEALSRLRRQLDGTDTALLGFVGSPWTLATYLVEGGTTSTYTTVKSMAFQDPQALHALLSTLADSVADYAIFQADAGAHAVQLFDSWGGQLPPHLWDSLSRPYVERVVSRVHQERPGVPIALYANGSGGLLERMQATGADVIGLDWTVDMADARRRLGGDSQAVQGNVDPALMFAPESAVREGVRDCVAKAGNTRHVLNLGHGVMVGTPEENVAAFFDENRRLAQS